MSNSSTDVLELPDWVSRQSSDTPVDRRSARATPRWGNCVLDDPCTQPTKPSLDVAPSPKWTAPGTRRLLALKVTREQVAGRTPRRLSPG